MANIPSKHDYRPDIPFTEPPVTEDDTKELPTVDLHEVRKQQAQRQLNGFQRGELELSSAEIDILLDDLAWGSDKPVNYWGLMEEEPIEPDAQMAAVRPLPLLARAAKWAGQTLTAWAEGQAS